MPGVNRWAGAADNAGMRAACHLFARLFIVAWLAVSGAAHAAKDFDLYWMKTRFDHEIAFRAAAIHVAWGAEALCDDTTEIEPFVLWSANAVPKRLSADERALLKEATGMDDQWRLAWLDEGAPDDLRIGMVVTHINDRPLPQQSTRLDMTAVFRGNSPLSADDGGFWGVLLQARAEALENKPMVLTLEGGRKVTVETQAGCAGSVIASAFDNEPDRFWRQGNKRAKIPGNALMVASTPDEFRWLAAFGTYFQATERAIGRAEVAESVSPVFTVGKVLTMALPGSGVLLTLMEQQTERVISVDGLSSSADLFANEVVLALGGDPAVGLKLNERMRERGAGVDELLMTDFRKANSQTHLEKLREVIVQKQAPAGGGS
ncbi:hypothetical protein DZC73_07710 [Albitalea terrae]|uniref:Uncharacterized protein n=2 Tax=Piscinibacter terrae TaxID=2496871 RepID=A0A3N7HRE3_9BURK|nr:hypothetical protein DZC73_07710 [Albitalea terrae]